MDGWTVNDDPRISVTDDVCINTEKRDSRSVCFEST